jgi:hypothetical protein
VVIQKLDEIRGSKFTKCELLPGRWSRRSTEWECAGVTGATVTAMIVRQLVEPKTGWVTLTEQGHASLMALLAKGG